MDNDNKIVNDLIAGGVIGANLGAIIANDSKEGATIGAIAGAVILATLKANNEAKQTHIPFYFQENNSLYEMSQDGQKHFVRNIEKSQTKLNKHFTLK